MTRDYEAHASRRRHEAATNIVATFVVATMWFGLLNPTWVGVGNEGTMWFLRAVGIVMLVAFAGIFLQIRRHRISRLDNDVESPPTGADAQQRPSA